ncbi:MAG: hypothetical protein E7578_05915 [Ruminococcaceae bacterium]|nr:hypothetical protein [Oscillospiraceae bacterium]
MKKVTAFVLVLAICISVVPTVMAYEAGDPCLLYGYDPDTQNDYETYGDEVFLRYNNVKSTSGKIIIFLNLYSSKKILNACNDLEEFNRIISNKYFPELNIKSLDAKYFMHGDFEWNKEIMLKYDSAISIEITLNDKSRENVIMSLVALAPRCDVDIDSILCISYNLNDVSNALKYIAGWGWDETEDGENKYWNGTYDHDRDGKLDLADVSYMLKVIAKWEID